MMSVSKRLDTEEHVVPFIGPLSEGLGEHLLIGAKMLQVVLVEVLGREAFQRPFAHLLVDFFGDATGEADVQGAQRLAIVGEGAIHVGHGGL